MSTSDPVLAVTTPLWRLLVRRLVVFVALVAAGGALAGVLWVLIVRLPTVTITKEMQAIPELDQQLAAWFATDAWFSMIGVVLGLGIGVVAWLWFQRAGWLVTLLAIGGALIAAFVCWRVGLMLGPGPFEDRLAKAAPGDVLPIAFELRAWPAFLLWSFAAITPVMLLAAFAPDTDEDQEAAAHTMSE